MIVANDAFLLLEVITEDPTATELDLRDWLITATTALALVSEGLENFCESLGNR